MKHLKHLKPSKKMLRRKIVIDSFGSYYTVGNLSKADLQFLVCALNDDLQKLQPQRRPYGEKRA